MKAEKLRSKNKKKQQLSVAALSIAGILFAYSAYEGAPGVVVLRASDMLAGASVGASASVAPNTYNTIAKQLDEKQAALAQQEADLSAREKEQVSSKTGDLPLYSFLMSLILTLLVGVNFYFDWQRRQPQPTLLSRAIINLRRGAQ